MRRNLFIMEGPDGCGKTEIGKVLAKEMRINYFKFDGEHDYWRRGQFKTALEFDQTYFCQYLEQCWTGLVIDRAWPSELVYSHVFDRQTNEELLDDLDRRYAEMGATIVLCVRRDYSCVEDEVVPQEKLQTIHTAYDMFAMISTCNIIKIYVDDFDDDVTKQVPRIIGAFYDYEYLRGSEKFVTLEKKDV